MNEQYLVPRHARMRIRIVRTSRFITNVVDERRARVRRPDVTIGGRVCSNIDAIVCAATLGLFVALYAVLGFILLKI